MSDPDAVTALYWLALFCASLAVGCLILRPRKRRNRYRIGTWTHRAAHPSFWANDNRGKTMCR